MKEPKKKTIRCAIYTRKSCEEGLEQEFNSLDAQREACESYIKSQQHEGWVCVEKQYNDGGFSGGTLERPALKELFEDIEAGKIDTVVVYKIDRLTRALMDFSKIVELFDKKLVTFVSITQQFNTTTSMGRLTLNILLSFAQFEREVTGERIRDKIAASKKKGMWMGGGVPIGYKRENKKLVPDSEHIPTIQAIYEKYLEFESVLKLKRYLDENDIKSRTGKNFSKGNLYKMLSNKLYIGMIHHKGTYYNGEHEGIIEEDLFNRVQELINQNRNNNKYSLTAKAPSLLAGKLFDNKGNKMSPSHSNKKGKRYRYYVSQAIMQGNKHQAGEVYKIPAGEIENLVKQEFFYLLSDKKKLQEYVADFDVHKQKDILARAKKLELEPAFIRGILAKIILFKEKVEIILCRASLVKRLKTFDSGASTLTEAPADPEDSIKITKQIRISTTSRNGGVLIVNNGENKEININPFLIKIIAKCYYWNKLIEEGKAESSRDIQRMENHNNNNYVKELLRLKFLAPEIVEAILNGTQPKDLTADRLRKIRTIDWQEQKRILNFA